MILHKKKEEKIGISTQDELLSTDKFCSKRSVINTFTSCTDSYWCNQSYFPFLLLLWQLNHKGHSFDFFRTHVMAKLIWLYLIWLHMTVVWIISIIWLYVVRQISSNYIFPVFFGCRWERCEYYHIVSFTEMSQSLFLLYSDVCVVK